MVSRFRVSLVFFSPGETTDVGTSNPAKLWSLEKKGEKSAGSSELGQMPLGTREGWVGGFMPTSLSADDDYVDAYAWESC